MEHLTNEQAVQRTEAVAKAVVALGITTAFAETFLLSVGVTLADDQTWMFGTANENWGGDLDGRADACITTSIPRDEMDPEKIARSIVVSLLAYYFSLTLREWLTPEQMDKVIADNNKNNDPGLCASYNFCDANMAMLEAFEQLGIKHPAEYDGDSPEQEVSVSLWNAAWNLAYTGNFKI